MQNHFLEVIEDTYWFLKRQNNAKLNLTKAAFTYYEQITTPQKYLGTCKELV